MEPAEGEENATDGNTEPGRVQLASEASVSFT